MAEFWILSSYLRNKCDENAETRKLCQLIALKYMEGEQNELRTQNAREETITLKLDVGILESYCSRVMENARLQAELEGLLKELYEEHLSATFDIDECQIEKLYNYEEIKIELETRELVSGYQQFYWRKIKMATKMEERAIVKQYRDKEKEFSRTLNERLTLEQNVEKLKQEIKDVRVKEQELHKCIYRLVSGSKEMETLYSHRKKRGLNHTNLASANKTHLVEPTKPPCRILHKGGLSSRMLLDFNEFKSPSISCLPKIRTINPTKGLSRLLEQAEVLRKSMQERDFTSTNYSPVPKLPSILKTPTESTKPPENFHKIVSFETVLPQTITSTNDSINITPTNPVITLDTTDSEVTNESDVNKNSTAGAKNAKIEIIENILIKPATTSMSVQSPKDQSNLLRDPKTNAKRKATEDDQDYTSNLSPKKKQRSDKKVDHSIDSGPKNFMDIFLEMSKDTSTASASIGEEKMDIKTELESEEKPNQNKNKIKKVLKTGDKKVKKPKGFFDTSDDFEDFLSNFAAGCSDDNDNDDLEGEMSFDFEGKESADDDGDSVNFLL